MTCCFHQEWTKGEKGQTHPSNTQFPAPNIWIILASHRTTASPSLRWALHSAVREIPGTSRHPIKATGALALRSTAAHSPAGKGFKGHQAQSLYFLREKTGPERRPSCPQTAQASVSVQRQFRCLERPSRYTAPPKLLNFSHPYFANSPLSRLPPASWKGKMANAGSLPLHFPPLISSQFLLPSLYPATPNKGSTPPWGRQCLRSTSFIQLVSECF